MRAALRVLMFASVLCVGSGLSLLAGEAPEPGFKSFFNGKDLTGWSMADKKSNNKPGESLVGKTATAKDRIRVDKGAIVIDGKIGGDQYIVTDATFSPKNCHIKFDFNPGDKCNNDILLLGIKFDFTLGAVKGLMKDEWNAFEIVVKDGTINLLCNGQPQKATPQKIGAKVTEPTPLSLRAEFGTIQLKNFRYKQD